MANISFWCEFPKKIDWENLQTKIDFPVTIYITCKTVKEYKKYLSRIKSSNIKLGAWPILEKKSGYWFSGYTTKKNIDVLKEFQNIEMKIDIEPPIPRGKYNFINTIKWLFTYLILKKPQNNKYLEKTILQLSKDTKIIVSGFPFPKFILKRYGDNIKLNKNISKNYMFYTSFFPRIIRPFYMFYLKSFAKLKFKKYKNKLYLSIGLLGPGIMGNEPYFKNINEFCKAINTVKKIGAQNIVFFRLGALLSKKDSDKWIKEIKKLI